MDHERAKNCVREIFCRVSSIVRMLLFAFFVHGTPYSLSLFEHRRSTILVVTHTRPSKCLLLLLAVASRRMLLLFSLWVQLQYA